MRLRKRTTRRPEKDHDRCSNIAFFFPSSPCGKVVLISLRENGSRRQRWVFPAVLSAILYGGNFYFPGELPHEGEAKQIATEVIHCALSRKNHGGVVGTMSLWDTFLFLFFFFFGLVEARTSLLECDSVGPLS